MFKKQFPRPAVARTKRKYTESTRFGVDENPSKCVFNARRTTVRRAGFVSHNFSQFVPSYPVPVAVSVRTIFLKLNNRLGRISHENVLLYEYDIVWPRFFFFLSHSCAPTISEHRIAVFYSVHRKRTVFSFTTFGLRH